MKIKLKTLLQESSNEPNWFESVSCNIDKDNKLSIDNAGVSCKRVTKAKKIKGKTRAKKEDIGKYFICTHRARTGFYDTLSKVPKQKIKFINSTG